MYGHVKTRGWTVFPLLQSHVKQMRRSYSCGVDHQSDFLQEQTLAFRVLSSLDRELCRRLTVPSVTLPHEK